ncbi:MAG: CBS domain-containing protein, partial [Porticoccaceae bacterium]
VSVASEACPLNLAPTTSTTATLVMGDALAIALLESRGFSAEDFAFSHPGGALGRKLLLRVSDIMHRDHEVPRVSPSMPLQEALLEMTEKGFGMTTVIDSDGKLIGVFTDGDLRRVFDAKVDLSSATIQDVMSDKPKKIGLDILAAEALTEMEKSSITALVVEDKEQRPVGIVHMHDILRAGVV